MQAETREEKLLTAISNGEKSGIVPYTRKEKFLSYIAGETDDKPTPITRIEMFLDKIERGGGGGGGEEWIGDGNTYIWITLQEGRTSPMLGVCPKGTVTVDWGDGTTPDVLTGTSVSSVAWTPTHEYAKAGDYVIKLTVDGEMGFYGQGLNNEHSAILRHSIGGDGRNPSYQSSVKKVEVGNGVTSIGNYAFNACYSLANITIPDGVTSIEDSAFNACYSLASIKIPDSVTYIGSYAFYNCSSLTSITIPDSVTSIKDNAFYNCPSLTSITIPNGVTSIERGVFGNCYSLANITMPDSVTSIKDNAFYYCPSLTSITIPDGVTSIGSGVFGACIGVRYYDFTNHKSVPSLASTSTFTKIPADCEILVQSALYDEWIAATNWSTYADKIVAR